MGVKFAGSRNLDDRRRRRLASENEGVKLPQRRESQAGGYWKLRRSEDGNCESARSPIVTLLPANPFRMWLLYCSLPIVIVASVLANFYCSLPASHPLNASLNLENGYTWRFFSGLLLLGCAAACWLISWFRSESVRDFDGCYKSWYWSGWVFTIFGICAGCGLHAIGSELIAEYARIEIPFLRTAIWMVPAAALMIEPARAFTREMWHSKRSWIGFLACCASGVSYLVAQWQLHHSEGYLEAESCRLLVNVTALLTPTLMFSALISQTYYVMYVSSDPVRKRRSWLMAGIRHALVMTGAGLKAVPKLIPARKKKRDSEQETGGASGSNSTESGDKKAKQTAVKKPSPQKRQPEKAASLKENAKDEAESEEASKKGPGLLSRLREAAEQRRKRREERAKQRQEAKALRKSEKEKAAAEKKKAQAAAQAEKSVEKKAPEQPSVSETTQTSKRKKKQRLRVKSAPPAPEQSKAEEPGKKAAETGKSDSKTQVSESPKAASKGQNIKESPRKTVSISEAVSEEDGRLDPEMLKGLSKKERRRLRKQFREQQRKAG